MSAGEATGAMDATPDAGPPNGPPEIRLSLPSRLDYLEIIDKVIDGVADQMEFDGDQKDEIAISVLEACTNSIQHAHNHDPSLAVEVAFHVLPDRLEVTVQDHGTGFDVDLVEDAGAPENLLKARGRGIFIMRSVMDEVRFDFSGPGTLCTLVKIKRGPTSDQDEAPPRAGLDDPA